MAIAGVTISGVKEIERKLRELEPKLQRKVVRSAMREGLKLVQAEARLQAPVSEDAKHGNKPGTLRRAIKIRAMRSDRRSLAAMQVQVGAGDFRGDTFYAAFVEYGTSKMAANPFLSRAYARTAGLASVLTRKLILDGINKIVRGG